VGQNMRFAGGRGRGRVITLTAGWRRALTTAVTVLLGIAGLVTLASTAQVADASQASGPSNVAVLDVVMLVDESGSETAAKVADEKQTVSTIVQSMLNPLSRVTVVGFGGVNHVAPHQTPVDVACVPTIASGQQNLSYLASCVGKLHRRTEAEGDDTDYAAALGQAMSYLSPGSTATPPSPAGAIKIILMMTDGAVDVHRDTQQYGVNWQEGEKVAIDNQLTLARKYGVQVWPLGFGTDIGTGLTEPQALTYLNNIAAGGAQAVCDKQHVVNQPHATWVNNPGDAISAVNQLYADAACLGTSGNSTTVSGGGSGTLSVTIPEIASDAAISVDRVNPNIAVGFTMPDGRTWTDASAISGQDNSSVVVLHLANITSADVGTWKVSLTAPAGLASQLVSATAFWQGAVRAVITANPPSAKLGQPVNVELDVLGPSGPITDQSALQNLAAGVTVTGDGLPGTTTVKVSPASNPGEFTGTFKAPSQAGTLTFTGSASGYGLFATDVPTYVAVGTANPNFTATAEFPVVSKVQRGDAITGQLIFTNKTGSAKQVRLLLSTSGATASITSPAGPVSAPTGNPPNVPFTVQIARQSRTGAAWLRVEVVDAANPSLVYNAVRLEVTVTKPPTFLQKYFWVIIGILILIALIIGAILWRRAVIRARKDVNGLVATLRREGKELGRPFPARKRWADTFRFVVVDEEEPTAHLDFPQPGFSDYLVKRSRRPGEVTLLTPGRPEPYDVVVGGPGKVMEHNGLELSFRDTRRRQPARGAPGGGRGSGGRGSAGRGSAGRGSASSTSQSSDAAGSGGTSTSTLEKDEWL
jgi:von Willebrand factor type A domain